jgi:hypothetical protein
VPAFNWPEGRENGERRSHLQRSRSVDLDKDDAAEAVEDRSVQESEGGQRSERDQTQDDRGCSHGLPGVAVSGYRISGSAMRKILP